MDDRMQAFCDDFDIITIYMSKNFYSAESKDFYISDLCGNEISLDIEKVDDTESGKVYSCRVKNGQINVGRDYSVFEEHALSVPLQFRNIVKTKAFNEMFFDNRDDFGARVNDGNTKFVVWAPLATSVSLILNPYDVKEIYHMKRLDKGSWEIEIPRDLHSVNYLYLVNVNGNVVEALDPYGFSSIANHRTSSVVDFKKIDIDFHDDKLSDFSSYTDAIIVETSVRDFSSDPNTNIVNKGKFLGMIEEGRTTNEGNKAGFDYFKTLGATHIQIMPVNDFSSTDEVFTNRFYNWGYDPVQYNTLEGSYSTVPNDPISRVVDFSKLVSAFHREGIRVNIDVVYNHMFDVSQSSFEKITPYYFFRRDLNGNMSNGSFCGNDVDTKNAMVRKFIIDSLTHLVTHYHIDGFRFDLMGIIDIETMQEIDKKLRMIKPSIMLYGEGWNMPTMLDDLEKSSINNAQLLPTIAFFNDYYRDNVKGSTNADQKNVKGYALGDGLYRNAFKAALVANTQDTFGSKMFHSPIQSLSYVEAHDNMTLWDKIKESCFHETFEQKKKRQMFTNAVVALSQGVCFYHMGQEFCRTKNGEDNSYRSDDSINMIDYNRAFEYKDVANYTRDMIKLRRTIKAFKFNNLAEISEKVYFEDLDSGMLLMKIDKVSNDTTYEKILVYFNPTVNSASFHLDDTYELITDDTGFNGSIVKDININPISIFVLGKPKKNKDN